MKKESKIYLAPIKGLTDRVYRNVFPKHFDGIDLAIAPFLSVKKTDKLIGSYQKEFEPSRNSGIKTVPQILSNNPDEFISIANILSEMGYENINWNLGCPYPMVVSRGKGAALLQYPDKINSFLYKTIPAMKSNLTIKLRLGMYSPDEILQLIPIFNQYEISKITIHARTGDQMYSGEVNRDAFEKALSLSKMSVVYNGDINSISDYEEFDKRFNSVNNLMIGRGILYNPFLAEQIKNIKNDENRIKIKRIKNFADELFETYSETLSGPTHLADKMKNIWFYLSNSFEYSKKLQKKIKKISNNKQYEKFATEFFQRNPSLKEDVTNISETR